MKQDSEKDQPELQWIENLVDFALTAAGGIIVGLVLTALAASTWLAGLWSNDPEPPVDK